MSKTMIDPSMTVAEAVARLYNRSKPQGMGLMHFEAKDMTEAEAQALLDAGCTYFDYLKGRVMKVSLDEIAEAIATGSGDFRLYDRDNGNGAAMRALTDARKLSALHDAG